MPWFSNFAQFDADALEVHQCVADARRQLTDDPAYALDRLEDAIQSLLTLRALARESIALFEEFSEQQFDELGEFLTLPAPSDIQFPPRS